MSDKDVALVSPDSCGCAACLKIGAPSEIVTLAADAAEVTGCVRGTKFARVKLDKLDTAGVAERRKTEKQKGRTLALEAVPWMLATVEGNTSDYNRQQGGTAAEYGYDVVLLCAAEHPRGHKLHGKVIEQEFDKRSEVVPGEGWDPMRFEKGDYSVAVEYLLRDQSDPTGMTFYRCDSDVDWCSIVNSRTLRMTGFELLIPGTDTQMTGRGDDKKYIKDRYEPGVRYTMPSEHHTATLDLCLEWPPSPVVLVPEEEEEEGGGWGGRGCNGCVACLAFVFRCSL